MPLPDYWPDARRIPKGKLRSFEKLIRLTREKLGLSNADLGREVRKLVQAHNDVPGRTQVISHAAWADQDDTERCRQELKSIRNGTRKYVVGYLAWLCMRDEAAAKSFYEGVRLPFRPYREGDRPDGPTPSDPGITDAHDDEDAFAEASGKDQFLVYEVAFLWFGITPPPVETHESAMTPEIAQMKSLLHTAIDLGKLSALHFQGPAGGYARLVQREELQRFAQEVGIFPQFLFPDREPSSEDMSAMLARLEAELHELLLQLPKAVTDWESEYARNEWAIYEAAFLWHGFVPPPMALHEHVMPEPVQRTKLMLHDAVNSNALTPAVDGGVRVRNVMVYGTRHVARPELRRFATSIGQRPRFLFPEDDERAGETPPTRHDGS